MKSNYVLHVYRGASGQVSGRLLDGETELFGVAGCSSVEEVTDAVRGVGYEFDTVLDESSFTILKFE